MVRALEELVEALAGLPTIGRKSAWRLALHLLERDEHDLQILADRIGTVKQRVRRCSECYNYSEAQLCPICASQSRNRSLICVVEKPVDVLSLERSGRFSGLYHVLGGVLSPIDGITVDRLRIAELKERVAREKPTELILGLGASADAEATVLYLSRLFADSGIRITRFARGLPAGMELEYVDQLTLNQALNERTDIHYTIQGSNNE
jgi:recombination protein RecR